MAGLLVTPVAKVPPVRIVFPPEEILTETTMTSTTTIVAQRQSVSTISCSSMASMYNLEMMTQLQESSRREADLATLRKTLVEQHPMFRSATVTPLALPSSITPFLTKSRSRALISQPPANNSCWRRFSAALQSRRPTHFRTGFALAIGILVGLGIAAVCAALLLD